MLLKTFFASFSKTRAALAASLCLSALSAAADSAFVARTWAMPIEAVERALDERPDLAATDYAELARIIAIRHTEHADSLRRLKLLVDSADPTIRAWVQIAKCSISVRRAAEDVLSVCVDESWLSIASDAYLQAAGESNLALVRYRGGDFSASMSHAQSAIKRLQGRDAVGMIAANYNNFGLALRAQGLHREALDRFSQGLELVEDENDLLERTLRFNVGVSSMDLGLYDEAERYMTERMNELSNEGGGGQVLTARTYRAMLELRRKQPAQVIPLLRPVVDDLSFEAFPGRLGHAMGVYGEALFQLGREGEAARYYDRAFELTKGVGSVLEARHVRLHFARVQRLRGELEQAEPALLGLIAELENDNAGEMLVRAYSELGSLREAQDDLPGAIEALRKLRDAEISARDQRFETQLALLRTDFDLNRTEQEVALLRQEQATADAQLRLERILLYGAAALAILLAALLYLVLSRRFEHRQRLADAEAKHVLEREVAERTAELEAASRARIEAIAERESLKTRIAEDDKLRVLGQLTGGVAHDFNNLLTVIGGNAELLQSRLKHREDDSGLLLENICKAVESGGGITRSLRAYARQQPMDLQPVSLASFVRDSLPLLRRTVGDAISVRADLPQDDVVVHLDPSQLTTALLNLCLNSADAISDTGELNLTVSYDEERAWLSVSDNGAGMSAETAAHAIEPFYSTKDESEHGGLGLSMVYGFAKQLGGDLRIDSEVGRGTEIWLSLPRAEVQNRVAGRVGGADGVSFGRHE